MPETTLYDALSELVTRLNASVAARNLLAAFPREIVLTRAGEDSVTLRIAGGEITLHGGAASAPDLALRLSANQRFDQVIAGVLDITHTLASGEVEVTLGKVNDLILLNRIIIVGWKK